MEREANYAAVGAFVLIVTLLGALFVYWYSDTGEHRTYDRYEIYFTGSVSGLDKGAAVRYLGVGVGRVIDLRIDPRDSSRVEVIVDVDSRTPISPRTVAMLQLQGVTGLLYIDLAENRSGRDTSEAGDQLGRAGDRVIRLVDHQQRNLAIVLAFRRIVLFRRGERIGIDLADPVPRPHELTA